jgi:hypothetical protein
MGTCAVSSADKRLVARHVGRDLIKHYGKKRSYTVPEVRQAAQRQAISIDWHCWAYALYTDRSTFDEYHRQLGESCDYGTMHRSMMGAVGGNAAATLDVLDPSPSGSSIELPDDSWSIFDWFDWSDSDLEP